MSQKMSHFTCHKKILEKDFVVIRALVLTELTRFVFFGKKTWALKQHHCQESSFLYRN